MQERIPQVCIIKENESMTLTNPHNYPGLGIPAARMSDDTSFNHVDGVVLKNSVEAKSKGSQLPARAWKGGRCHPAWRLASRATKVPFAHETACRDLPMFATDS